MQYLLLIYGAESAYDSMSEAETGQMYQEFGTFTQELLTSGKHRGGSELHRVAQATTVRVRDGKRIVTDGPFAETKEQLGGFYLVEAADLDEATAMAAKIPSVKIGSIEIRPIVVRPGM